MGSKKRGSDDAVEEAENQLDIISDKVVSEPLKKKMKKEKKKKVADRSASPSSTDVVKEAKNQVDIINDKVVSERLKKKMKKDKKKQVADGSASPSSTMQSIKPMERKKKRKALDKEKRYAPSDNVEPKPKQLDMKFDETRVPMLTLASSGLPEFHISVFKDLASADSTVREAAVEALVTELQEVQSMYDKLERKDVAEGGLQLEAEKDDGLNNCAPSLRYAVRRLIRGVSSSRECARQGFALGLTVLVGAIPSIKVDALLKLIVDLLEVSSSMKGQAKVVPQQVLPV